MMDSNRSPKFACFHTHSSVSEIIEIIYVGTWVSRDIFFIENKAIALAGLNIPREIEGRKRFKKKTILCKSRIHDKGLMEVRISFHAYVYRIGRENEVCIPAASSSCSLTSIDPSSLDLTPIL